MKLGFYYHIPAMIENGVIRLPGYLGRFLEEVANHVDELILFLHQPDRGENAHFDHSLRQTNVRLVSLPPRGSALGRLLNWTKFKQVIDGERFDVDKILVRAPSPLSPWVAGLWPPEDRVFLLVGDYVEGVNSLPQPFWRKELIRLFAWWNEFEQVRLMRNSLVFANSKPLLDKFAGKVSRLYETRTTTLSEKDIFVREDTCQITPIHLFYAGRLDPAKGLMDIAKAVISLAREGHDLVFDVAGWEDNNCGILGQIENLFDSEGESKRFNSLGYRPVGEDLFSCYRNADIFITASIISEGFPRTIWEAMAHGLPVVATDVGSIKEYAGKIVYLSQPSNIDSLKDNIVSVISDRNLRINRIGIGYRMVSQMTSQIQVMRMFQIIKENNL